MGKSFAWGVLGAVILSSALGAGMLLPAPASAPITIWEAYARGNVTITQVDVTYDRGGYEVTFPVGYKVANTGGVDVVVDEPGMLMSPSPSQLVVDPTAPTTQDGSMTTGLVPAHSSVTFYYADEVLQGFLPTPMWWCTEQFQFTQSNIKIVLGGEILPSALQDLVRNPYYYSDSANTQNEMWNFLKTYPVVVVGKTPFWQLIPNTAGQVLPVTVTATNIAVKDDDDAFHTDVDAHGAVVRDVVPAGWTVVAGSFNLEPTRKVDNPDGTKTLEWVVNINGADVTGKSDLSTPTPYNGVKIRYKLETPRLAAGRLGLPRAEVDTNADGAVDAHSEIPVLDVFRVNTAPTAIAGGPYLFSEGTPFQFDAGASSDPDGDALMFRWDLNGDGAWDTEWSASALSPEMIFGDDATGTVIVQISDGALTATAGTTYEVRNVNPRIESIDAEWSVEGAPVTVTVTFTDSGWLDTHVAFVDWGFGAMDTVPLESSHGYPEARGSFTVTHAYGDDYDYPVLIVVTDDDLGSVSATPVFSVGNVAPVLTEVHATATVSFGLRVAGEKWHDVQLMLYQEGALVGTAGVVRTPGSPDEQAAWIGDLTVELLGSFNAVLSYTPDDDPINGQPNGDNPAWLLLRFEDGSEARLKHNFNVQHPATWTWTVDDLLPLFVGHEITLAARASDVGTDDLSFEWDFGDGTSASALSYNNGGSPDPRPSPDGVAPFVAASAVTHTFASGGGHTITLTIRDDDGGQLVIVLPLGV